jgi:hypothetical protein
MPKARRKKSWGLSDPQKVQSNTYCFDLPILQTKVPLIPEPLQSLSLFRPHKVHCSSTVAPHSESCPGCPVFSHPSRRYRIASHVLPIQLWPAASVLSCECAGSGRRWKLRQIRANLANRPSGIKWLIVFCLLLVLLSTAVQALHIDTRANDELKDCPFCQVATATAIAILVVLLYAVSRTFVFITISEETEAIAPFDVCTLFSRPPPLA